jgi:hypothetical protein
MTTPKEIAEKIIELSEMIEMYSFEDKILGKTPILARAYLELEKENAAEKADKQRVIDIGVNMQRRVNDRVEAENKILLNGHKKIDNMYWMAKSKGFTDEYINYIVHQAGEISRESIEEVERLRK